MRFAHSSQMIPHNFITNLQARFAISQYKYMFCVWKRHTLLAVVERKTTSEEEVKKCMLANFDRKRERVVG